MRNLLGRSPLIEQFTPGGRAQTPPGPSIKEPSMGLFSKDIKTLNDLFVHQLQDIYYAEKQLVKANPKLADKATNPQLKLGFLSHLKETKSHVARQKQV